MIHLVQVVVDGYLLPNKGTYKSGSVVALSDAEYNAIPGTDFGSKVQNISGRAQGSTYLVTVLGNNYKLSNNGFYDATDIVALTAGEFSRIPNADLGSKVAVKSVVGLGAYSAVVGTSNPGRIIPRSFLGIGMEVWEIFRYSGQSFAYNALAGLNVDGNNTPTLRIGGGSADTSWWNPSGAVSPSGLSYSYNDAYISTLSTFLSDTGMKVIVGLNMGYGDTSVTSAWAAAALAGLPTGSILAFQIGNEPDIYNQSYRASNYNLTAYLADVPQYIAAVNSVIGSVPLSMPAFANFYWLDTTRFAAMDTAFGAKNLTWDWHYYATLAANNPTISALLSSALQQTMSQDYAAIVSHADSVGKTVRVSELNSIAGGGKPGVSDSQAGALWMLRTLLELAQVGVAAVNVHGLHDASYTPINVTAAGEVFSITANYYGMKMFALATQHDAQFMPVTSVGFPSTLSVYTLYGADRVYRTVLINVDGSIAADVDLVLPTTAQAIISQLTAPSLGATSGITLAGQTWDGSTDGNPVGSINTTTTMPTGNTYPITVPPNTACLVEVST